MAISECANDSEGTSTHISGACDGGNIDDCTLRLDQVWSGKMDEHQRATHVGREHLVEAREVTASRVALCVHAAHAYRFDVVKVRSTGCIYLNM